ncbi:MAG: hypothetical protein VKJ04_07370 [Vampirovibrionales bacterium]|nr:hypothetical protein [Vampirovibrionales bacterium]
MKNIWAKTISSKKLGAWLMLGAMAASITVVSAYADDEETLNTTTNETASESTVEPGPFTSKYPVASHIVTSPLRLVTTATAGTMGLIGGIFKGTGTGVQDSLDYAADFGPKGDDIVDRSTHGALYVPTATVGTLYFVPKNIAVEGGKSAWDLGSRGYQWWNRL